MKAAKPPANTGEAATAPWLATIAGTSWGRDVGRAAAIVLDSDGTEASGQQAAVPPIWWQPAAGSSQQGKRCGPRGEQSSPAKGWSTTPTHNSITQA